MVIEVEAANAEIEPVRFEAGVTLQPGSGVEEAAPSSVISVALGGERVVAMKSIGLTFELGSQFGRLCGRNSFEGEHRRKRRTKRRFVLRGCLSNSTGLA